MAHLAVFEDIQGFEGGEGPVDGLLQWAAGVGREIASPSSWRR